MLPGWLSCRRDTAATPPPRHRRDTAATAPRHHPPPHSSHDTAATPLRHPRNSSRDAWGNR
eukprot:16430262-Heterocapsa_arctica.AAC.1